MTSNSHAPETIRAKFAAALARHDRNEAIRSGRELLAAPDGARHISFMYSALEKSRSAALGLKKLRIALLSSFTIEFLRPYLVVQAFLSGIEIELYLGGFGQFQQEIRNPQSGLYSFAPDALILAVEGEYWLPDVYERYFDTRASGFEGVLGALEQNLKSIVKTFRQHSAALLLINNFAPPVFPQLGILDAQSAEGQRQLIAQANGLLRTISRSEPGVLVVDYEHLVCQVGAARWCDQRMKLYIQAPMSVDALARLAREYATFFRAMCGLSKKCLVLDLDNTLWGGVIGEDGLAGIRLDPVYPGSAFLAFQREILHLHQRGVVLAIASKNNASDVEEVFNKHPHMLLKSSHFSAVEIHWEPKSVSIVRIAKKLNLSPDHLVFIDDNPAECEEVSQHLSGVTVIRLPKQPELYVQALFETAWFDGLSFSSEDQQRGQLYRQRDEAEALRENSASLDEFLKSLEMEISFSSVAPGSLPRAAQLTQKTNQLNTTTLRLTESEISSRMRDPACLLTTVRVIDRFGDNGIVGLMIALLCSDHVEIEVFLLSCRVIGRNVETAMLAWLCERAARANISRIQGRIVPTPKNGPVRDLFERHGFSKVAESGTGETFWSLDLNAVRIERPKWTKITVSEEEAIGIES